MPVSEDFPRGLIVISVAANADCGTWLVPMPSQSIGLNFNPIKEAKYLWMLRRAEFLG